ncbi:Glycosyltransferase, GT2 family [Soonwooa buanensis]|uniref:Glycosyltransferase, GT2 family n=1 Tax=Soonwooa buanensis TaxID=619805 RepID=A0A1T5EUK7_9FLAO|nr:glycosyltransferase family 2 protein [Soonwooa buanensis]SKB87499.1 Glycosyltransferase, GT2 family [Soonwooa buanensis]
METVEISIIIVTYNSQDLIKGAIDSIYNLADISKTRFEIIIVDNSPFDGHQLLKKNIENNFYNASNLYVIHNVKNGGYGQGNNVGICKAKGKIICIMNPDVLFLEPLMKDALLKFQSNSQLALLGYKQTGGFDYSFYLKPEFRNSFSGFQMKLYNKFENFSAIKHYLSGAFFFIDKEKFEKIGLFDENIFMYFEEPDVSNRLLNAGYEIQYDKSKKYMHLVGNRIEYSDFGFKNEMKSLLYYIKKHGLNKKKFLTAFVSEYRVKMRIAKIIGDTNRLEKFSKELSLIQEIFI